MIIRQSVYAGTLLLMIGNVWGQSNGQVDAIETIGESAVNGSLIDRRLELERRTYDNPFVITPHRPTYILPISYTDDPDPGGNPLMDQMEMKFQFSFKIPLVLDLFGDAGGSLAFGYTQRSYWQAFNDEESSPFRETNHEPEIMLGFLNNYTIPFTGFKNRLIVVGLNHQSNGRSEPQSRSWNRLYLDMIMENEDIYLSFKPWWRIPESESTDNNADIDEYMGRFELRGILYDNDERTYGFMIRNNLHSDENRGALQLDWTFPIAGRLDGYFQYFNGYGESLIEYDRYQRRYSVGVMLTNWL